MNSIPQGLLSHDQDSVGFPQCVMTRIQLSFSFMSVEGSSIVSSMCNYQYSDGPYVMISIEMDFSYI
jgi:hypothetical protein